MEMNVRDDKQLVDIWLTNAEKNDPKIREGLKAIYDKYKKQKYLVVVYESGERDLYRSTSDLLTYNKRRLAELDVRREKKQSAVAAE